MMCERCGKGSCAGRVPMQDQDAALFQSKAMQQAGGARSQGRRSTCGEHRGSEHLGISTYVGLRVLSFNNCVRS